MNKKTQFTPAFMLTGVKGLMFADVFHLGIVVPIPMYLPGVNAFKPASFLTPSNSRGLKFGL